MKYDCIMNIQIIHSTKELIFFPHRRKTMPNGQKTKNSKTKENLQVKNPHAKESNGADTKTKSPNPCNPPDLSKTGNRSTNNTENAFDWDQEIDTAIEACGGDQRAAIKMVLKNNLTLEARVTSSQLDTPNGGGSSRPVHVDLTDDDNKSKSAGGGGSSQGGGGGSSQGGGGSIEASHPLAQTFKNTNVSDALMNFCQAQFDRNERSNALMRKELAAVRDDLSKERGMTSFIE